MTSYFLGIDIGGTKSHGLISDEKGNALGFGTHGPGNHEEVGYDGLRIALRSLTKILSPWLNVSIPPAR